MAHVNTDVFKHFAHEIQNNHIEMPLDHHKCRKIHLDMLLMASCAQAQRGKNRVSNEKNNNSKNNNTIWFFRFDLQ